LILAGLIGEFCASERESSSENKRGNDFQLALSCEGTSLAKAKVKRAAMPCH
jgi:hypothetical protein